jgi:hypothetical protein
MNGTPLAIRGERLGFVRTMMFRLGIPIRGKSYTASDRYMIRPRAVSHFQEVTDEAAEMRKRERDKKAAEKAAAEKGGNGKKAEPAMTIPSGK